MTLDLAVASHARDVDVSFALDTNESLAIVGPNASGKSSVLLAIAGLLKVDSGHVSLNGKTVFSSRNGQPSVNVPVHKRGVSMLVQRPFLFPHMSVRANVEFGPRSIGLGRAESRNRATYWLERVGVAHLADRHSHQLSGGQSQRVALARALAVEPKLLLLDEPMAALDAEAIPAMRVLLAEVAKERPTVLVTHDVLDAISLSTQTIVIEGGRVSDSGPTQRVLLQPRTSFGARLGGLNVLRGTAQGDDCVVLADGQRVFGQANSPLALGQKAIAVFSPSSLIISRDQVETSARNSFHVTIDAIDQRDGRCRISAGELLIDITLGSLVEMGLAQGQQIHVMVKAMEVALHPS